MAQLSDLAAVADAAGLVDNLADPALLDPAGVRRWLDEPDRR